jgi:hypothetical protein
LEFDAKTAALIDTNQDGRIRAPELIAAVKWAGARLKNPDHLIKAATCCRSRPSTTPPRKRGHPCFGPTNPDQSRKKDADAISLADASDANKIFADTVLNGDGVILPESAKDKATQAVITEIADCLARSWNRSGKPGIDQAKVDAFFTECADYEAWIRKANRSGDHPAAGEATRRRGGCSAGIKAKVDDFFGRCGWRLLIRAPWPYSTARRRNIWRGRARSEHHRRGNRQFSAGASGARKPLR